MFGRWRRKRSPPRRRREVQPAGPRVSGVSEGDHGNHWCAVFGFEDDDHLGRSLEGLLPQVERVHGIGTSRVRLRGDHGLLATWGIEAADGVETLYPVVTAAEVVPVTVREIVEWMHVGCPEAQIRGGGRDTFGLDFFAVDFAEQRPAYRSAEPLPVALAGLAYVLDEAGEMPESFEEEFCGYLPNAELPGSDEFDFVGTVLAAERGEALGESFSLLRVRLIRDEEDPEMFNLPILVNDKAMRCAPPAVGDRVSGCLWLQGRVAD